MISTQIELEEELTSQQLNLSCSIQSFFCEASSSAALFSLAAGQGFAAVVQSKGYRLLSPLFSAKFSRALSTVAGYITEGICFNIASEFARSGEFKIAELGETIHGISTIALCKIMNRQIFGHHILIQNLLQNSALITLDIGFEQCGFIEQSHFSLIERYTHCQITSFRMEISANLLAITCPQVGILKATQELDYKIQNLKNSRSCSENKNGKSNNFLGDYFSPRMAEIHGQTIRASSLSFEERMSTVEVKDLICLSEKGAAEHSTQMKYAQRERLRKRKKVLIRQPLKLIPPTAQRMLESMEKESAMAAGMLKGIWITLYCKIHYLRKVSDKKSLMEAFEVASYIYLKNHSEKSAKAMTQVGISIFFENVPEHETYFYPFFSIDFKPTIVTQNLDQKCWITSTKTAMDVYKAQRTIDSSTFLSLPTFVSLQIKMIWEKYDEKPETERKFLGFVTWIRKAQKNGEIIHHPAPYSPAELAIDFFPVKDHILSENIPSKTLKERKEPESQIEPKYTSPSEKEEQLDRIKTLEDILRNRGVVKSAELPSSIILLITAMAEANMSFKTLENESGVHIYRLIQEITEEKQQESIHSPESILKIKKALEDRGATFDADRFFIGAHPFLIDLFPTLLEQTPHIRIHIARFERAKEFDLAYSLFKWRMGENRHKKVTYLLEAGMEIGVNMTGVIKYESRSAIPRTEPTLQRLITLLSKAKSQKFRQMIYLAVRYPLFSIIPVVIVERDRSTRILTPKEIEEFQKRRLQKSSRENPHPAYEFFLGKDKEGKIDFPSVEELESVDEVQACSETTQNKLLMNQPWESLPTEEKWVYYLYDLGIKKYGSAKKAAKESGLIFMEAPKKIRRGVHLRSWTYETLAQYAISFGLSHSDRRKIFLFFRKKQLRELLQKKINA